MPAPTTPSPSAAPSQSKASPAATTTAGKGSTPSSPSPRIPASHQPTPAQQNPSTAHRTLAPTLPPKDQSAPDPIKEMNDRQRNAIATRVQGYERQQVTDAGVDGTTSSPTSKASTKATFAPKPKAAEPAKPTAPKTTSGEPADTTASKMSTAEPSADATTSDADASSKPDPAPATESRTHRYDLKSLKKWAEENPEQAQEAAKAVFGVEPTEGFIRLQNKKRKVKNEIREAREAANQHLGAVAQAAKADREKAEAAAQSIRWMTDMWEAARKKGPDGKVVPDFDMMDEAFRTNSGGLTIDDYMRQRARRGVSTPELARERAQRIRMERELAQLRGQQGQPVVTTEGQELPPAAVPALPPAKAEPKVNTLELWGDEIADDHQLRQFAGWSDELHKEMRRHYDESLDEYDREPEEIADALLAKKLSALAPDPLATPATGAPARKRPNTPKRRASTPAVSSDGIPDAASLTPRSAPMRAAPGDHKPGHQAPEDFETTWSKRQNWAVERHNRRMRGEEVD